MLAKVTATGWERLLDPPKPPTGIDRLPIPGRPLGDQWRDLCLWLTVQAHQLIRATDDIELKDRILEQHDALIRQNRLPLTLDALRLRVGTFKTMVEEWCTSRIRSIVPKAAAWPELDE
jgi:hypothetical protein